VRVGPAPNGVHLLYPGGWCRAEILSLSNDSQPGDSASISHPGNLSGLLQSINSREFQFPGHVVTNYLILLFLLLPFYFSLLPFYFIPCNMYEYILTIRSSLYQHLYAYKLCWFANAMVTCSGLLPLLCFSLSILDANLSISTLPLSNRLDLPPTSATIVTPWVLIHVWIAFPSFTFLFPHLSFFPYFFQKKKKFPFSQGCRAYGGAHTIPIYRLANAA